MPGDGMQAIVLCGGLGTRMWPRTEHVPKVLLEVAGRPFLHHLVERIEEAGYSELLLLTGHLGHLVEGAAGELGTRLSVRVASDGGALLGTAGALRAAAHLLAETFLVTYGDSYLTFDYAAPLRDLRAAEPALGCMAVWRNGDALEPSNCAVQGGRVVRYDKARAAGSPPLDCIDYGATALRRAALTSSRGAPRGLDGVVADLARRGLLLAHEVGHRFYEIGSPAGIADLERHLTMADATG